MASRALSPPISQEEWHHAQLSIKAVCKEDVATLTAWKPVQRYENKAEQKKVLWWKWKARYGGLWDKKNLHIRKVNEFRMS